MAKAFHYPSWIALRTQFRIVGITAALQTSWCFFTSGKRKPKITLWNLMKHTTIFELMKNSFKIVLRFLVFKAMMRVRKLPEKILCPNLSGCLLPFQIFEFHRKRWPKLTLLCNHGKIFLVLLCCFANKTLLFTTVDTIYFLPVMSRTKQMNINILFIKHY